MVVDVGGVAVGPDQGPTRPVGPPGPAPASGTRRDVMRGLLASAGALALAPVVAASRPVHRERPDDARPGGEAFDEVYQGHHIRGVRNLPGRTFGDGEWHVTVDGRPLHLMRRADGTWLTMVDHYASYPTPLEAARAAVDELGPVQKLREAAGRSAGTGHHTHEGGHHGVRP
ncbi:tyrosinase family oxidase copper chaperone [Streptomyces sp. NPDC093094]|uniref:tyrosinase family oxidase copper chaperone n=1 Tax=Streptomyces sp. NPDC093094 TaxID=3366026 RepID=UPI00380A0AAA